jgi:hypothetical protein
MNKCNEDGRRKSISKRIIKNIDECPVFLMKNSVKK